MQERPMFRYIAKSPGDTLRLGRVVGERVRPGMALCLEGDLGAGKTLFAKGMAKGMGIEEEVTSPTFGLMNIYEGRMPLFHFDLYRLESAEELEDIGFYEYVSQEGGVAVIEWPDRFPEELPEDYVHVHFGRVPGKAEERHIRFFLQGEKYRDWFEELGRLCRF